MNLVFNLEAQPEKWTIQGPVSSPRRLESPLSDERFRPLATSLREWASRPVPLDRPDPLGTEAFVQGLARRVSGRLTETLLTEDDRRALATALAGPGRVRLVIRVRSSTEGWTQTADAVLALPWELLAPETEGVYPVRDGRLAVIREAVTEQAPDLPDPSGPLTLAVTIAAPEDRAGFPYEQESFRLLTSLAPLGQQAVFSNLGGLSDLADLVADIRATAIHFRGHGLPGGLLFEDELGFAAEAPVAELRRRLAAVLLDPQRAGTFPSLFFLAAPFTAQEAEEAASAAALHRSGFAQVIGFFGPVDAELNTRLEERFYSALAAGRSALAAVEEARSALLEPVGEAGERVRYPFGWCQLAVYHRGPDRPLARPGKGGSAPLDQRRTVEVSGLPVLEHGFIGRRGIQHEVRRRVDRDGQRLVVIQGLGGLGKTALASQLLVRAFAPEPADQLVLRCRELDEADADPVLELRAQAEEHGRLHGLPFWDERVKDLRERVPDPAAGLAAVLRLLRRERPGLAVYIDNAETLQSGPSTDDPVALGSWRPGLEAWWREMERLAEDDGCLVMVTTRYAWEGLPPRAHLGLPPMEPADSLRLIDSFEALGHLPLDVRIRLAGRMDGHPRTVEFLDRLIAQRREEIQAVTDAWTDLIAPILPAQEEKIRADLLLEKLWEKLSEEAKEHARALTVLRRPAPQFVIDRMGVARDELIRAGWLTQYREQVRRASDLRWFVRWGLQGIVREHLLSQAGELGLRVQQAAADAWEAWLGQPGSLWGDDAEAIHHLHILGEGDRAWPIVQSHVLWLRRSARYPEAREVLAQSEHAGTTGERLARTLLFQVQMRRLGGERRQDLTSTLQRAEGLAESHETRAALLHEQGVLLFDLGDYASAEGRIRATLAAYASAGETDTTNYAAALHELGEVLKKRGHFHDAEERYRLALEIRRRHLGTDHRAYGATQYALAGALTKQDRFAEAEALLRDSLRIDEQVHGADHPDYASSLHELAVVLGFQGKSLEAEGLLRKALDILDQTLGERHPDTGATLHELARALSDQGKYQEAVNFFSRSAEILAASVGTAHADYAVSLTELASALAELGQYEKSEGLLLESLAIFERSLGTDHPNVGASLQYLAFTVKSLGRFQESAEILQRALQLLERDGEENQATYARIEHALGTLLERQGRYEEAESCLRRCLEAKAKIWGVSHREYTVPLGSLANVLSRRGRYREAEDLLRNSLEQLERTLGAEHPSYGSALFALAGVLDAQARFGEAEGLLRQYMHLLEGHAWTTHPAYGASLMALAGVLSNRGFFAEAERLVRQSAKIIQETVGEEHPDFGISLHQLGAILFNQGRLQEAADFLRRALSIKVRALGEEHPSYAASLHELGVVLQAQGDLVGAEGCLERCAAVLASIVGTDHANFASTLHALAGILSRQGRYEEAETLLRRSIEIKEKALGPSHPSVGASLANLANALVGQGRLTEAESLLQRALALAYKVREDGGPDGARVLNILAQLQSRLGRAEAPATARQALQALHAFLGKDHPATRGNEPTLQAIARGEI